nr:MAG TPA: hypothetical protein [Caudoviricetes sp.]
MLLSWYTLLSIFSEPLTLSVGFFVIPLSAIIKLERRSRHE